MAVSYRYPLIFLHIPKAAGTTLKYVFAKNFGKHAIVRLYVDPSVREQVLKQRIAASPAPVKLIEGHFPFGIDQLLPEGERLSYLSFVRHPVSRLHSFYHYIRTTPEHYYHRTLVEQNLSFEQFLGDPESPEVFSQQTRLFAGCRTAPQEVSEHDLELARNNIRNRFLFVGLQEKFDESLVLLKLILGLNKINYVSLNRNVSKPRRPLSKEAEALIRQTNRYDLALYEFIEELFAEQRQRYAGRFEEELEQFRKQQSSFQQRLLDYGYQKYHAVKLLTLSAGRRLQRS